MTAHDEQTEARANCICERVQHGYTFHTAECEIRAAGWLSPEEVAAERRTAKINA